MADKALTRIIFQCPRCKSKADTITEFAVAQSWCYCRPLGTLMVQVDKKPAEID